MEKFETFVINLERRRDRLDSFLQRFPGTANVKKLNIFKAVDGNNLKSNASLLFAILKKSIAHRNLKLTLNSGEVGCLLSHVAIWKKIVDENIQFAHIYEDDALFAENFVPRLQQVYKTILNVKPTPAVVYTGGRKFKNYITKNTIENIGNLAVHSKKNWNNHVKDLDRWLHAYVISKRGAQLMLDMVFKHFNGKLGIDQAVVMFLNKSPEKTYSATPLLCYSVPQGDSDIRNWGIKQHYCDFSLHGGVKLIKFPQFIHHQQGNSLTSAKDDCEVKYGDDNCRENFDNLYTPAHRSEHNFMDTSLYINTHRYRNCAQLGQIAVSNEADCEEYHGTWDGTKCDQFDKLTLCGGGSKIPNLFIEKTLDFTDTTNADLDLRVFNAHRWKASSQLYTDSCKSMYINPYAILTENIVDPSLTDTNVFQIIFEHAIPTTRSNHEKISLYLPGKVGDEDSLWAEATTQSYQTHIIDDCPSTTTPLDCNTCPLVDDSGSRLYAGSTLCNNSNRSDSYSLPATNKMNSLSLISHQNKIVLKLINKDLIPESYKLNLYVTKNTKFDSNSESKSSIELPHGTPISLATCTRIEHVNHMQQFSFKCEDTNAVWDPRTEKCVDSCNTRCWHKIQLTIIKP